MKKAYSKEFFDELERKLLGTGVDKKTVARFLFLIDENRYPENVFPNDRIPDDECFKTLEVMYKLFGGDNAAKDMLEHDIMRILTIPYSRVMSSREKISDHFIGMEDKINELYETDDRIYPTTPEETADLIKLISKYIDDIEKQWEIFKRAMVIGAKKTRERFISVEEAIEKDDLQNVLYETSVNGFLLYPYYNDPTKGITYLKERFDSATIGEILVDGWEFLYWFKEDHYFWIPGEKEIYQKKIDGILKRYI